MPFSVEPTSETHRPISSLPLASPHLGKQTWASSANRSRMLPPVDVVPPLSKAFRYSSATDLRCSSVMVWVVIAMSAPPFLPSGGGGVPDLAAQADQVLLPVGGGEDVVFHPGDERLPVAG